MPAKFRQTLVASVLGIAVLLFVTPTASAQVWRDVMLTNSRDGDVLQVQTDLQWSQRCTFGVAKVVVSCNKPSSRDRDLEVMFYLSSYSHGEGMRAKYRLPLRLEQGRSRVEVTIPHVQDCESVLWDMGIFENRRDIEDKPRKGVAGQSSGPHYDNQVRQILAVAGLFAKGEEIAEYSRFAAKLEDEILGSVPGQNRVVSLDTIYEVEQASLDWRTYHAVNCWVVSPQALAKILRSQALCETLRTYLSSGGQLLLHSAQDSTTLSAIDELLGLDESRDGGWQPASGVESGGEQSVGMDSSTFSAETDLIDSLADVDLKSRAYVLGRVYVAAQPLGMLTDVLSLRNLRTGTHGVPDFSGDADGNWFWRNLIRAVGKPPIWMFCAMVALFGALLGPGLLVFTGRLKRRSLMILFVPAFSLLATVAIVAYSVLHEGFTTHLRITSVQAIDSGRSFAWSRQNYFSGLPPREGLNFRAGTYVRPVQPDNSGGSNYYRDPRKSVGFTITQFEEGQNWSNWLRPRQQQQLLIGHAVQSTQLPVAIQREPDGQVKITNLSKSALPIVLLRGEADDYYFAEALRPNASVKLSAIDQPAAAAMVAKQMVDYRPQSPPELGEGGTLLDFSIGRTRYATVSIEAVDVLNAQFQRWLSDRLALPKFGFSILATESEVIEVPLSGQSNENLHLIIGVQRW